MDTASTLGAKDIERLLRKVGYQQVLLKEATRELSRLRWERRVLLLKTRKRRPENR